MDSRRKAIRTSAVIVSAFLGVVASVVGSSVVSSSTGASDVELPAAQEKSGAQLWAQECARCHDMQSPEIHGQRAWDLIMHHMRLRANLTAKEYEAIREFLESSK